MVTRRGKIKFSTVSIEDIPCQQLNQRLTLYII